MNWTKVFLAALLGGIANNLVNFALHGFALAATYERYSDVFSQEQANPLFFLLIAIVSGVLMAILFAKTRSSWAPGARGGLIFGLLVGALVSTLHFFHPLVIEGFPYYLAWCWIGIDVIAFAVEGVVMSFLIKE
jgi:hypothetical protein